MVKRYTWLSLLVIGLFSGNKAFAQFPYFNSFKTSDQTGVTLGGTAKLTSGVSDPVDDGVLRLTSSSTNQRGYGYIDSSFPFNKGIKVEFEYFTYGGLKADGITFFLFDPSSGFEMGQFGGA